MKTIKHVVAASLVIIGVSAGPNALAMPGFSERAPESSIQVCVAEIGKHANYENAGRVRHEIDSKAGRVGGYKLTIETTVFADDSGHAIREYATVCAMSDESETKRFKFKEKNL